MSRNNILNGRLWWLWLIGIFAAVSVLSSFFHTRIDLTEEHRFSLTPATQKVLKRIDEPIQVDVYLTGDLSAGFRRLHNASEELLSEFRELSNHQLQFRFIRPLEGLNDSLKARTADSLQQMGIKPFTSQVTAKEGEEQTQRVIYPWAVVVQGDKTIPVDLMSGKSGMDEESTLNFSEALLEFKFADAIDKITRKNIPVIAYAAGNGEPLNPTIRDLFDLLRNNYRFGVIDLNKGFPDADTINTLLIVKPAYRFTETEKLKIDQFVMQGGNVIWFIDKLYAEIDSLFRSQADFVAFDKNLDIDDILFRYGVRINGDLLQDLKCARQPVVVGQQGNQPQIQRLPFPYYPLLSTPSDHPIARNLDDVLSIFPGTIDTVKAPGIKKTILLASDTNSRTLSTPAMVTLQSIKTDDDFRTFKQSNLPVAVLLEGSFTSLFANRVTPDLEDSLKTFSNKPFLAKASKPSKQIVVSDGDIVTNVVTRTDGPLNMGVQQYENYQFANREFLMNTVDYLANPGGVLEARNKNIKLRLLDREKVETQKARWQLVNIIGPILLVLVFGGLYQQRRRKQYTS